MKLHKLMDFNRAFYSYDTLDGANCQTVFWEKMTQKEAAVQAVKKIGLNQISEIPKGIFGLLPEHKGMFERRYGLLREL